MLQMYSFPPVYPVVPGNMNYVCVVYFIIAVIVIAWWFIKAKADYNPEMLGGIIDQYQ